MEKVVDIHTKHCIRTDCYLAVLKRFREQYPDAHFEVITRIAHSVLSPSWELLEIAKKEKWDFKYYKDNLLKEFEENPAVWKRIKELQKIVKTKDIFLICYEKNSSKCHRSIIKTIIERGKN